MKVHLINSSDHAAVAICSRGRDARVLRRSGHHKTLEPWDPTTVSAGDVVGIGIHTSNAVQGLSDEDACHPPE